ncbi:DUF2807 domain-containing protein [Stakelama sp. CBK3Z-3]|uniref:DUF2807 domain-containing protein n=1 Tax=Stakelama flava TaxID=2860338 RepID=A0ABS6XKB5_9SPHN|nr:head GIN domain-containing protein [Stakelama flava]MBW4330654.1 DUF2807 domain-containing protein [Stakelama flava]
MRFLLVLALAPIAACNSAADTPNNLHTASDNVQRSWNLSGFEGVETRGSTDISISTGKDFSIRGTGSAEALDRLQLSIENKDLRVDMKKRDWPTRSGDNAHLFITMPRIARASTRGSGDIDIDRAEGDFDGAIAGSGDMHIGALSGGNVSLSITGSGDIDASGNADMLTIAIAGSGDVSGRALKAARANVSIAGSGDATATVTGPAQVALHGSGDVDLGSSARCTISKAGSGDVHCG